MSNCQRGQALTYLSSMMETENDNKIVLLETLVSREPDAHTTFNQ